MKDTLLDLKTRRSIRSFKTEQIQEEVLKAILEAGMYAPTGMNAQSPLMVVVQEKEQIKRLSELNAKVMGTQTDPFYGAPTVVIVFADKNRRTYVEDGSLVMGNLMNAAHALGIGSCWIHRAREVFDSEEGRKIAREWGVSEDYIGIGNCVLGYVEGDYPEAKPRKEDYIIYADKKKR